MEHIHRAIEKQKQPLPGDQAQQGAPPPPQEGQQPQQAAPPAASAPQQQQPEGELGTDHSLPSNGR